MKPPRAPFVENSRALLRAAHVGRAETLAAAALAAAALAAAALAAVALAAAALAAAALAAEPHYLLPDTCSPLGENIFGGAVTVALLFLSSLSR